MTTQYNAQDSEVFPAGMLDWFPQRLFLPEPVTKRLPETTSPCVAGVSAVDGDRNWVAATQDITIIFSEPVSDASLVQGATATGWTATVNGVSAGVTYRSGSGTATWVLRIAAAVRHTDLKLSYSQSTGATISVTGSVEINSLTAVPTADSLTKRVRFALCDSTDASVVNEAVKAAVMEYDSGTVANTNWMVQTNKGTVTTDGTGEFDMQYTGTTLVGSNVYVVVFRATENLAVAIAVT